MHSVISLFKEQIQSAITNQQSINIRGGNTKHWYGDVPHGVTLDARAYQGILDYQPEELVITVCAGTPLKEVESSLAEKKQYFAFDPPCFGSEATIGGMIASGIAGPGRGQYGGLRDYVLGTKIMDGRGQVLSFGGKVMKNVAGYDVSRLLPGSLGTLSLLLEVSIKVLPQPAKTQTLKFEIDQAQAIIQMNTWASQPLPLSASAWIGNSNGGELWVRLAGANAAVEAGISKMNQLIKSQLIPVEEASLFWQSVKEQEHSFFKESNEPLWRFAINPLSPPLPFENQTLLEWYGGQRWIKGHLSAPHARQIAHQHGGHATLFRGAKLEGESVFTPLSFNPLTAPLEVVQQRIRQTFDPHSVFKTGRMPF
jgi:glycolate oxidase FAD binding subunit